MSRGTLVRLVLLAAMIVGGFLLPGDPAPATSQQVVTVTRVETVTETITVLVPPTAFRAHLPRPE